TYKEELKRDVKHISIPVYYGGEYGPDLEEVAHYHGLQVEDVIRIHSETTYFVYMLGFTPGFPYLGGLSKELETPRKEIPRLQISPGSVGIGGNQTGIYPLETP
ncbi:5-oxoprolinase subunit PxpB, partial [Bacillus cereus group sp. Bce025]